MQLPNSQPQWAPMQSPAREPRRYGALAALVLSFFSGELYRDVGRRWRGYGFWYLVLLLLLTAIPYAVKAHIRYAAFVKDDAPAVVATCPSITVKQGKASSDIDPYLWIEPRTGNVILYVDTTGAFDDVKGKNAVFRLSDKQLFIRKSPVETNVYNLNQLPDFSFDKNSLSRLIDASARWVWPVVLGVMFIGPLIGHHLQVLLYGAIGLLFCLMFDTKLSYGSLVRLAVVALTPALLIDAAVFIAGVDVPYSGWIYFAIEMAFLLLAVKANAAGQSLPPGGFPVAYGQPSPYSPPAPGGYGAPPSGYVPPGQYPPQ